MKDLKQTLLDLVLETTDQSAGRRQIVYLEGGYYDTRFGPQDFSINTLSTAISVAEEVIKRKYKVIRVILGVLVNNIGIVCGDDVCVIPNKKNDVENENVLKLPEILNKMLKKSKVTKNDPVILTNEKTLRNRGLRIVKKIVNEPKKYNIVMDKNKEREALCSVLIDGEKIPLTIKRGKTWSARCPLIMGQHYVDLYIKISKKYGQDINLLVIDMGEMYDRHKMNNGAKVALVLLHKMYGLDAGNLKIANFSFQDDQLMNFEYDLTEKKL